MKIEPGAEIGEYHLVQLMGRGGLGQVWTAERRRAGTRHALKLLPERLAQDEFFRSSFHRRAESMAALKHPRLVGMMGHGRHDGGFFLVMEYVPGPDGPPMTLSERASKSGGRLPEAEVRRLLLQVCEGLDYAHSHGSPGIPHLDLKPHNVLIDAKGDVRIADLGLVRLVSEKYLRTKVNLAVTRKSGLPPSVELEGETDDNGRLDTPTFEGGRDDDIPIPVSRPLPEQAEAAGALSGWLPQQLKTSRAALNQTADYLSPEQKEKHSGDHRSDIYALGVMAYELLTGQLPGDKPEPPSKLVKKLPPAWDHFVAQCMAPTPEKRPAGIAQAMAMLTATGPFAAIAPARSPHDSAPPGALKSPLAGPERAPAAPESNRHAAKDKPDNGRAAAASAGAPRKSSKSAIVGVVILAIAAIAIALLAGAYNLKGQSLLEVLKGEPPPTDQEAPIEPESGPASP